MCINEIGLAAVVVSTGLNVGLVCWWFWAKGKREKGKLTEVPDSLGTD